MSCNNCNCTPCTCTESCDGPQLVTSAKYATVSTRQGCKRELTSRASSILVHGKAGRDPVYWGDGSANNPINLANMDGTAGECVNELIGLNAAGDAKKFWPVDGNGKQQIIYEGGKICWKPFNTGKNCFPTADITQVSPTGTGNYRVAVFSNCGPDGQECLHALDPTQCGSVNASGVVSEEVPAGTIMPFAGPKEFIPDGFIYCDGRFLDTTTYAGLFDKIGYIWGKSSNDFAVPDLRGYALRGFSDGTGVDPDAASRTESGTGGSTGDNPGTLQSDAFQCHEHIYQKSSFVQTSVSEGTAGGVAIVVDNASNSNADTGEPTRACAGEVNPRVTSETRMKNAAVVFMISVGC